MLLLFVVYMLLSSKNTSRIGEPSFLMVLTGGEFAYKRKDERIRGNNSHTRS